MSRADEQPFQIRVLSIATSPRRAAFTERADTALAWSFHDASTTNTTGLPYDEKKAVMHCSRPMLNSEIGCFSSHLALWRLCMDADRPLVVIEDDVDVDWRFLEQLSERYAEYSGYEYLRFASTFKAERIAAGRILDRGVDELLGNPRGTQGYLMRPSHARRLVQRIRRIERSIDDEIDRCWVYGAPNLVVTPPIVTDRGAPSEIVGDTDIRKIQTPSVMFFLAKIMEKIERDLYIARRKIVHRARGARVYERP